MTGVHNSASNGEFVQGAGCINGLILIQFVPHIIQLWWLPITS